MEKVFEFIIICRSLSSFFCPCLCLGRSPPAERRIAWPNAKREAGDQHRLAVWPLRSSRITDAVLAGVVEVMVDRSVGHTRAALPSNCHEMRGEC